MQIVQAPNPVLSESAKPVKKLDQETLNLIEEMKTTLASTEDPKGIGLAAPQVGKSLQLFIIKEEPETPFSVFINPLVTLLGKPRAKSMPKKNPKLEGCLSLKDIWGTVKRSPKVSVTYKDENWQDQTKLFNGFFATIVQHEYDHLQGILFPKRTLEQGGKLYKSHKDEKGEEVFDPIEL